MSGFLLQIVNAGASDSTAMANTEEVSISLWELIQAGGWYFMIPLGFLFVLAIFIFIERYLAIKKALVDYTPFLNQVKQYISNGDVEAAKLACQNTPIPVARMLYKGIIRIGKPLDDIASSVENTAKLEIYNLESRLSTLATVSGAAPMLGFLGTTVGMISTFQQMSVNGVDIQNLSGGIMQAMVTTVAGLVIGIIAYVGYNTLVAKVEKVIHAMENSTVEFMDILQSPGN